MSYIIQRYIFREMATPFFFSIGIFTITSLLIKVPHLIQLIINHGVGFLVVVQFIVFILPSILIYVIPVSFLIAVLIAYNRLSSDNEITAMKASGLGILKISRSVVIMALFAYTISSFFTIYAFPWGSLSSKRLIYDMARNKASIGLRERAFNSSFNGLILYANRIITENGELEGIFISDKRDEKDNDIIVAKNGIISSDPQTMKITLRLFNGRVHRPGEEGLYKIITFNTYDLNLSLKDEEIKNPDTSKTNKDLTVSQLKAKIDDMKSKGRYTAPHIIDLHKRFALPASVFVFGLLGIPLGIQRIRTIRFTSFTIGLAVMLFYYVLSTALESLGDKGLLNPVLAVWGTDIIMAALGIAMLYKAAKDSPIKSLTWLEEKKEAVFVIIKTMLLRRKI